MGDRTTRKQKGKPKHQAAKPYDGFPLTAHPSGRWCKKYHGKQWYFGPVDDWQSALDRFHREWKSITKGNGQPSQNEPVAGDEYTLAKLSNEFLNAKRRRMESGEITARTFQDCHATCDRLIRHFGRDRGVASLNPADFEKLRDKLAKRHATANLKNVINRYRGVFAFANSQRKIEVDYGGSFDRPSAKSIRKANNKSRREGGVRMFEAAEVRMILDNCDSVFRAMVLLGVNAGLGNSDVASLPEGAIDFEDGWLDYPREKTGIERRVPLWPETLSALREAIAARPHPKSKADADLVFLTHHGARWVRIRSHKNGGTFVPVDALSPRFTKLLKRLGINGRRRLGFYALRHSLATIGGDARDPDATTAIMGHVDSSMGAVYRERIADERLRAVTETVRRWLFENDGESG